MKIKKYIKKFVIFILIFTLITIITIIFQKTKGNKESMLTHQNLEIKTSDSIYPYSYYRIYLYINKDDSWNPDTFYYNFLEKPDDYFCDNTINVEGKILDISIFEKYNVLIFAKKGNYSFTLDSYYLSDSSQLELTLNEYATYENFGEFGNCAFGGIFMIPKEEKVEDIKIFLNKRSENDDYIVHKESINTPSYYYNYYSEKLIDKQLINDINLMPYGNFYMKLITSKTELFQVLENLEFINTLDLIDSTNSNFFEFRNILVCCKNSNGYFNCEPEIEKDFYYQDIWHTKNLKIKEYYCDTSQEDYISYYTLIPLPKTVSLENITVESKQVNYKNFEDTPFKINLDTAEKIAQNHFNTTSSLLSNSYLEIVNTKKITDPKSKEYIENPLFKRMWHFKYNIYNEIYIDASTGEVLENSN